METLLAGDIGGTNTRLALYAPDNLREPLLLRRYRSGDYSGLQPILAAFYADAAAALGQRRPARAAFGVAGPADAPHIKPTNLPWTIDVEQVRLRNGLDKVAFLNDFAANCLAVPHLTEADRRQVGGGAPEPGQPIAVLGAGTGLGVGFLVHDGGAYRVLPSEGGHADFAPRNALELRLLAHLLETHPRVTCEHVLSGAGLARIYAFLRDREGLPEAPAVYARMRREDPAAAISATALAGGDALCERALDIFCALYGAEAGNLALRVLARGGVYLAGGIARKILPRLAAGGFRRAFEDKAPFAALLEQIPTYVILHPEPGLMGAAIAASRL